jgi:hypothetical protein
LLGRALALLPLIVWLIVHAIASDLARARAEATRELLFFALSLCALTITELQGASHHLRFRAGFHTLLQASLFVIVVAAVLYGGFLTGDARGDRRVVAHTYSWAIAIAAIAFGLGMQVQRFLGQEDHHAGV